MNQPVARKAATTTRSKKETKTSVRLYRTSPSLHQRKERASFSIASVITPRSPGEKQNSSSTPRIKMSKSEALFSRAGDPKNDKKPRENSRKPGV